MANPVIDTDITDYTISELLTILGIDSPTKENVTDATNKYIDRFQQEENPEMEFFFQDMQDELLDYIDNLSTDQQTQKQQADIWYSNETLTQPPSQFQTQNDKITDRSQKIQIFDSEQVPMKREQLGINNTYSVPVAQDVLNPNLKNTITQLVNLDSQYRQTSSPSDSCTDYTLDLSEHLTNVLSLKLYSFQIPYTWYTIDTVYGNTCFWVTFLDNSNNLINFTNSYGQLLPGVQVTIVPGNYTSSTFPVALNQALYDAGFLTALTQTPPPITINIANAKLTVNLIELPFTNPHNTSQTAIVTYTSTIIFFDPTAEFQCTTQCVQTMAINQTLGWIMGFRLPYITVLPKNIGNTAPAVADFYGPKYLILVIDDYNQNHINSGLVGITETSSVLKLPSYYSPDLPYVCTRANTQSTNLQINTSALANDVDVGTLLMDKMNATYSPTQQFVPSAPRTLTQTQIYTINEILKNNEKTYSYRLSSPTSPNTFALIPVKSGMKTGDVYVDFGGSLQENKRIYFGPVNIVRLRLRLLDDRGNVLNLNGADWSVTLMSENLYQY